MTIHKTPLFAPVASAVALTGLVLLLPWLRPLDAGAYAAGQHLPKGLAPTAEFLAWVASVNVIVSVAVIAIVILAACRQWRYMLAMGIGLSTMVGFYLVKETVRRARPINHYVTSHGYHDFSFPSGHAAGSLAVYGLIALLVWRTGAAWLRWPVAVIAGLMCLLIGVSRVYLGAHFATDVLGGWLLAALFGSLARLVYDRPRRA